MGVTSLITQFSAPEQFYLGFMANARVAHYQRFGNGANTSQSPKLYTSSKASSQIQAIRIRLLDEQIEQRPYFWIEYRTPVGYDANATSQVNIYYQPSTDFVVYYGVGLNWRSSAKVGAPFFDPFTGIKVTVNSTNADFADTKVEMPGYQR